ncbi:unnamed protein product [Scytosiphon promiscuus]
MATAAAVAPVPGAGAVGPNKPNPIAALIRRGAEEAGRLQGSSRASTKVQRMINSLQWRQAHSKDEIYPLPLESGVVLEFRQLQAGEVTGLGTGATVWPAAHVLAKYLERRFGKDGGQAGRTGGMGGLRAVDLGSGTGVAGIVASALGAEAFLTDQEQLLFLMQENANRASRALARPPATVNEQSANNTTGSPKSTSTMSPVHADATAPTAAPAAGAAGSATALDGAIRVLTYDWGADDERLAPPVDVVLVSDCVLPKLYPIEPLVDAIDRLSGPDTVTIMSYEHRHYQDFDPRTRFEELAAAKGLVKTVVPQGRQHPIFSADDIEIWEVRRRRRRPRRQAEDGDEEALGDAACGLSEGGAHAEPSSCAAAVAEDDVVIFQSRRPSKAPSSSCEEGAAAAAAGTAGAAAAETIVGILGEQHVLAQAPSGALGCYLWPSAVVMARHLVTTAAAAAAAESIASDPSSSDGSSQLPSLGGRGAHRYPTRARVLELGSGVGLAAMTAALLGWDVVCTDKADALPLLELNVNRCISSTKRECAGKVQVMEYKWGTDAERVLDGVDTAAVDGANGSGFDVVICADCVYAGASVEPLLESLCQVCGENTVVLVTNELRSAFDEFVRRARALRFEVEDVDVPEAQMVVDAARNQRPKPVTLKRLRRRRRQGDAV